MSASDIGWTWFEGRPELPDRELRELEIAFAKCFAGSQGARALAHLRSLTLDRHLGPGAGDAALRHLEGQRHLVAYILAMVERGRTPDGRSRHS